MEIRDMRGHRTTPLLRVATLDNHAGAHHVSIHRLIIAIAVIMYPMLLLWALQDVVSPNWEYAGYYYLPPTSSVVFVMTSVLAILPGLMIPIAGVRPSLVVLWMLYLLAYVPAILMPIFASGRELSYLPFQCTLLVGFVLAMWVSERPARRIFHIRLKPGIFWFAVLAFTFAVYFETFRQYGFPTGIPDLGEVYDVRAEFSESSTMGTGALAYTMGWQYKVLNPFFVAYGAVSRKPWLIVIGVIGQLIFYSLTGHKTVLFSTVLILALFFVVARSGRYVGAKFSIGASSLVLLATGYDVLLSSLWGTSLFVRRLIMTPGVLTGYYHDFFSSNAHTYQFGPFLRWAIEFPYEQSVPRIIGSLYTGNPDTSANANIWADGFASFGYPGIFLYSVILGAMMWMFNSFTLDRDRVLVTVVAGVAAFNWVNSSLMTSIGTHGIAFAVLLLIALPSTTVRHHVGPLSDDMNMCQRS